MGKSLSKQVGTSGLRLTDDKLRSAAACLEKYHFKESYVWPRYIHTTRSIFEALYNKQIQSPTVDIGFWTTQITMQKMRQAKFFLPEIATESPEFRNIMLALAELRLKLPSKHYNLIWGPDEIDAHVSKTPIRLHISGIFKPEGKESLHVIDFTPYRTRFDIHNDPVTILKLHFLSTKILPYINTTSKIVIHQLYENDSGEIKCTDFYSGDLTEEKVTRATHLIHLLEANYHFPSNPCPDIKCAFRKACVGSDHEI
jgi:hypothetical protein